uniref:probable mediator of RNA polymerase II transcription subunit 26c n=1 Tax=Erigeron canadensis TaxID=72917 RepID=UPI001CB94970|nr:probable mediator of RNA polymerase II transcription subunit 26c [Erigeron canadensis]
MGLTLDTLEVTGIGKTVRVFRKHESKEVSQIAGRLMKEWKDVVEEWLKNDTGSVVNPTTSEEQVMPESLITDQKSRVDSAKSNKATGLVTTDLGSKKVLVQRRLEAKKISSIEDRYETAKRKLQHSYQEAENAKNKRRIQVTSYTN